RDWLNWLKRAKDGVITQGKAAEKMGVTDRWVRKLLARMKTEGDGVVLHGLRGRSSNRKIAEDIQKQAVGFLRQPDWHDFGPKLGAFCEARRDPRKHGRAVGVFRALWPDGGYLHGSRLDIYGGATSRRKQATGTGGGSSDADWAGPAGAGNRLDSGLLATSQRSGREKLRDRSGPADQTPATGESG